jgi:anion-transporting  ArsA/GET3 family ATPase
MANAEGNQHLSQNRIIKILARPYGGMNEILSLIEVQMQIETGLYETIVLDTPPGSHFLDFLESLNKMKNFFDQNFVEIFHYLGEKTALSKKGFFGQNFIKHIVSSGVRKLLTYLQSVTGAQFIEEFIEALSVIYKSKSAFLKGLKLQDQFKSPQVCNWFLVTSVEQGKAEEAVELKAHASHFIHHDHLLILNKCLSRDLDSWDPQDTQLQKLKFSLYSKEESLKKELNKVFHNILEFPEIISGNPSEHVTQLAEEWNRHVSH